MLYVLPCWHNTDMCAIAAVQPWCAKVVAALPEDQAAEFKTKSASALKFLVGMVKELQL